MKIKVEIIFKNLYEKNYYKIDDELGKIKIIIGKDLILERLKKNYNSTFLISDNLMPFFKGYRINSTNKSKTIFSIGNFNTHNKAKKLCKLNSLRLITCPAPLSNDSFCTNRLSIYNSSSIPSLYPNEIIIDLSLLSFSKINNSITGIGEFVGLYFSIFDFFISRKMAPPFELTDSINNIINLLKFKCNNNDNTNDEILKLIAISLIIKCYIMRNSLDYQIGCGIDHLFANAIEYYMNCRHGKAVFLGSIISNIFLEKNYFSNINTFELTLFGINCGIISITDLIQIQEIGLYNIFTFALNSRPNRISVLRNININAKEFKYFKNYINFILKNLYKSYE